MSSQTSIVIDLFAVRHAKLRQHYDAGAAPSFKTPSYSKPDKLTALPLQTMQLPTIPLNRPTSPLKTLSWLTTLLVLLAHIGVIYLLITHTLAKNIEVPPAKPIMVSLIAPPALKPELVKVIELPKPEVTPEVKPLVKTVVKPKKVVEKIKLIETPTERFVEATTEQPMVEEAPAAPVAPVVVAEAPKALPVLEKPVVEKIVEEKVELPRFGVSYLNNPAPDYPPISRRLGEEGRVLMKVLVSADGSAENVEIEKSSGSERLDNAAMQAVKRWKFIPAKKNNQALSAYVIVPVKFSLDS